MRTKLKDAEGTVADLRKQLQNQTEAYKAGAERLGAEMQASVTVALIGLAVVMADTAGQCNRRSNWLGCCYGRHCRPVARSKWLGCWYGRHCRPVARSKWLLLWPTLQASGTL